MQSCWNLNHWWVISVITSRTMLQAVMNTLSASILWICFVGSRLRVHCSYQRGSILQEGVDTYQPVHNREVSVMEKLTPFTRNGYVPTSFPASLCSVSSPFLLISHHSLYTIRHADFSREAPPSRSIMHHRLPLIQNIGTLQCIFACVLETKFGSTYFIIALCIARLFSPGKLYPMTDFW